MPRQKGANIVSWVVAGLVAVGGLGLVGFQVVRHGGNLLSDPYADQSQTTTITKTTPRPRSRTTVSKSGASGKSTETTTRRVDGGRPVTDVTRTTAPVHDSVFERSVAGGAILLLQVALVALAAFIAGAGVQRIILARYGIKVAGLEIADLPDAASASQKAIDELRASLDTQVNALKAQITQELDAGDQRAMTALNSAIQALNELQTLQGRVRLLEEA